MGKDTYGSKSNFFELDFDKYEYLFPQSFLKTTRQFAHEYNIHTDV